MPSKKIDKVTEEKQSAKLYAAEREIANLNRKIAAGTANRKAIAEDLECAQQRLMVYESMPEACYPTPIVPVDSSAKGAALAVGLLSDVHPYETVRPERVSGLNEYNVDICTKSMDRYFQTLAMWVDLHRHKQNIKQVALAMLGDIVGNMLHPDQKETNAGTVMEEVNFMLPILMGGIKFLYESLELEHIHIWGVHGNHDRGTDRVEHANEARHAYTWILYHCIKRELEQYHPEISASVAIAEGYHLNVPVFGRTIRAHHGHAIKFRGGVGGLLVPARRIIQNWNESAPADLDISGHAHSSHIDNARKIVVNGSILGYSTYAISKGFEYEPPQQWFLLLDKDRWLTARDTIYVR